MAKRQKEAVEKATGDETAPQTDQATLHNWLVLARLITISQGAITMKKEHFQAAFDWMRRG